jgi:hypothetical protein
MKRVRIHRVPDGLAIQSRLRLRTHLGKGWMRMTFFIDEITRRTAMSRIAALFAAAETLPAPSYASPEAPDDPTVGRHIVFADNFSEIDWSRWDAGPKATTDPSGYYGRSAFSRRGGESKFNPYSIVDDPRTANGKALEIAARYIGHQMNIPNYYGNSLPEYQWVSGNLQGARPNGELLMGWREGYFEARMLFPRHPLTWAAFWLLNKNSILKPAASIEIDIVEQKGWEPHQYGSYLHEWGMPGEHNEGTGNTTKVDMTKQYNLYGVLIAGDKCAPYFNRKPVLSDTTGAPVRWVIRRSIEMADSSDVFFPLLTLALRSDVPYPNPLSEADKSSRMLVDYFRVYQ